MTFADLVLLCLVGGAAAAAFLYVRKEKKAGRSCGGCAGCPGGQGCCRDKNNEMERR